MDRLTAALNCARSRRRATLASLLELLRFPTVSADPRRTGDVDACAAWLARRLRRIGLHDVQISPGRVAPVVTAGWRGRPGLPTVLVYGHYDVQPPGPSGAWRTDPFRPARDGSYLYARGASDDKGQLMAHLAAIEAWLATAGELPVSLRLVLDGEEEIGSPTLVAAAARRWAPLGADVAVVSDTWMLGPHQPVVISGLRGLLAARLEVSGPARDLHAGAFGGAVANPAEALAGLIAGLHGKTGRIAVDGFYDGLRPLTDSERDHLARAGPSDLAMLGPARAMPGHGEPGFSAFERVTRRPAIVVTGLRTSGQGRTVVPRWASADLNVRLAAGQQPGAAARRLRRHLHAAMPSGVRGRLVIGSAAPPYILDQRAPVLAAVRAACGGVFGRAPVLLPSGGSIPIVGALAAASPIDIALLGFGLPDDAAHAANERFYLPNLWRGAQACIALYQHLGLPRGVTGPPGGGGVIRTLH